METNSVEAVLTGIGLTFLAVTAYGLLHSLLASTWVKSISQRIWGDQSKRYYRLLYNVLSLVLLLPVLAVPILFPGIVLYEIPCPLAGFFVAGQVLAVLILLVGLMQTDPWHFLGLRQFSDVNKEPDFQIGGLYRWVRHPLYTAGLAFIWLAPVMATSLLALNISLTAYIYIGSIFEERKLLELYGQPYAEYRKIVPRLIPKPWKHAPRMQARPNDSN